MKRLLIYHLIFMVNASRCFAQNYSVLSDSLITAADTTPIKLLPEKLSPMKRALWGERGLMRRTGIMPLNPRTREKELKLRRKMLTAHQVLGLTALTAMVIADYAGQKTLDGHQNFASTHKKAVGVTIGTYFLAAGAAVFSPPPLIIRKTWSNVKTHKLLAYLHFTGMVLTPILAPHLVGNSYSKQAHFHQISGYVTTALFASAIIVLKF